MNATPGRVQGLKYGFIVSLLTHGLGKSSCRDPVLIIYNSFVLKLNPKWAEACLAKLDFWNTFSCTCSYAVIPKTCICKGFKLYLLTQFKCGSKHSAFGQVLCNDILLPYFFPEASGSNLCMVMNPWKWIPWKCFSLPLFSFSLSSSPPCYALLFPIFLF